MAKVVGIGKMKDLVNQWYRQIVTAPARVSCVSVKAGKPEICLRTAEGGYRVYSQKALTSKKSPRAFISAA